MAFSKNFYIEHEEISKLTSHEVQELRRKLALKVRSYVDSALMHLAKKINAHGYMQMAGGGGGNVLDAKKFPDPNLIAFMFFGNPLRPFKTITVPQT